MFSHLDADIVFSGAAQPACLPEPACEPLTEAGRPVQVNGFGANFTIARRLYEFPDVLQTGNLTVQTSQRCRESYRDTISNQSLILGDQICALGTSGVDQAVDSCSGDSGGGLIAYANGRAVVVGAVSFGRPVCGSGGFPGVYTRVASHMDWITEITGLGRTTLGTCNGKISFY